MKTLKTISLVLFILFSVSTATCFADIVSLKAGDVLTCDVLTGYIGLSSPYQNLFFKNEFIADITCDPAEPNLFTITTINNDIFSGKLINSHVEAQMNTGSKVTLAVDTIKTAHLDTPGDTKEKETTVFFMKNGDRFSGQLLTSQLHINTGQLSLTIAAKAMKRIVFIKPGAKWAEIYLNDGTMVAGDIVENALAVALDSAPNINVCIPQIHSIQFNAKKYITKTILPQDYSDPATGKPQFLTMFPQTPIDITNGGVVCPVSAMKATSGAGYGDFKISNVHFDTDKSDIRPADFDLLDRIAAILKDDPSLTAHIKGHTDTVAGSTYNQALSMRRAYAVARYLEDAGVENPRISISGYGLAQPIADNKTNEGRAKNRRVEIELLP